jgi:hypothetical protein
VKGPESRAGGPSRLFASWRGAGARTRDLHLCSRTPCNGTRNWLR